MEINVSEREVKSHYMMIVFVGSTNLVKKTPVSSKKTSSHIMDWDKWVSLSDQEKVDYITSPSADTDESKKYDQQLVKFLLLGKYNELKNKPDSVLEEALYHETYLIFHHIIDIHRLYYSPIPLTGKTDIMRFNLLKILKEQYNLIVRVAKYGVDGPIWAGIPSDKVYIFLFLVRNIYT